MPRAGLHMAALDTAVVALHLVFAGIWAGSVVFVAFAFLPAARDGTASPASLATVTGRLVTLSRVSALVLLLTGGHMAGTFYTVGTLAGTIRGQLVLGMVLLWFALAALVEVGGRKLDVGLEEDGLREAADDARPYLIAAAAVAIVLLIDGGLLSGGVA